MVDVLNELLIQDGESCADHWSCPDSGSAVLIFYVVVSALLFCLYLGSGFIFGWWRATLWGFAFEGGLVLLLVGVYVWSSFSGSKEVDHA